jgi:hypothetical protein
LRSDEVERSGYEFKLQKIGVVWECYQLSGDVLVLSRDSSQRLSSLSLTHFILLALFLCSLSSVLFNIIRTLRVTLGRSDLILLSLSSPKLLQEPEMMTLLLETTTTPHPQRGGSRLTKMRRRFLYILCFVAAVVALLSRRTGLTLDFFQDFLRGGSLRKWNINPDGKSGCSKEWFGPLKHNVHQLLRLPAPPIFPKLIKKIFIYWQQGFDNAPPIIVKAVNSWIENNPTWEVILITDENLHSHLDDTDFFSLFHAKRATMQTAAFSDLLRLWLLGKYGGVWVDATTLCNVPLDSWLPFIVDDELEFFAFRNFDYKPSVIQKEIYPISSWFLYGSPTSEIIQRWKQEMVDYWDGRTEVDKYFWMHYCFFRVMQRDLELATKWTQRAIFGREEPHAIANAHVTKQDFSCTGLLGLAPVYKLSYRIRPDFFMGFLESLEDSGCKYCNMNETDCSNDDSLRMFESLENWCEKDN